MSTISVYRSLWYVFLQTAMLETNASVIERRKWSLAVSDETSSLRDVGKAQQSAAQARRHMSRKARKLAACPREAVPESMCEYFRSAQTDFHQRASANFSGWHGSDPTFHIPYEVKWSGDRGLGVFTTTNVTKGTLIYEDVGEDFIWVPTHAVDMLLATARAFPAPVVEMGMSWCGRDWVCRSRTGIICEFGDARYINDNGEMYGRKIRLPTMQAIHDKIYAARDLIAGEELTESYTDEDLSSAQYAHIYDRVLSVAGHAETSSC